MHDIAIAAQNFITLDTATVVYLFLVGFVGGLVSGFIGSGGAFVLTPAMMSLGVPGLVAVASNMCHKFPKALVGALKRAKYGQVDVKLGIIFGIFAEFGVLLGAAVQEHIKETFRRCRIQSVCQRGICCYPRHCWYVCAARRGENLPVGSG